MHGHHPLLSDVSGGAAASWKACRVLLVQQLEAVQYQLLSAIRDHCRQSALQEVLKVGLLGIALLQCRHDACHILCLGEPRLDKLSPTESISDSAPSANNVVWERALEKGQVGRLRKVMGNTLLLLLMVTAAKEAEALHVLSRVVTQVGAMSCIARV